MPRQPRYSKKYNDLAREAILAGKNAPKALALALGITPTLLKRWLSEQPDFAAAIATATTEADQRKAAPGQPGRPSTYDPANMDDAARLEAATGKDDAAIAKALRISASTLRNWRLQHESFAQALQEGRDRWNVTAVEESLIKRAQGYKYTETTQEDSDKGSKIYTHHKHMPPDTRAAQFVLTNRAPERWKMKQEMEVATNAFVLQWQEPKENFLVNHE